MLEKALVVSHSQLNVPISPWVRGLRTTSAQTNAPFRILKPTEQARPQSPAWNR
jgi:hypothetical protein